jgi:hypothetical protein
MQAFLSFCLQECFHLPLHFLPGFPRKGLMGLRWNKRSDFPPCPPPKNDQIQEGITAEAICPVYGNTGTLSRGVKASEERTLSVS